MHQLSIDPFLLIRSPAYSYNNFKPEFLVLALKSDFFRASLFVASDSLYLELRKKEFDYDQLSPAAKTTLWKYFNRMCFRALPYGFFSSYSCGYWSDDVTDYFQFTGNGHLFIHPDFRIVADYISTIAPQGLRSLKYYTNSSIYQSARELRFISQAYAADGKFAIVQLKIAPGLNSLLSFAATGKTREEILSWLRDCYGEDLAFDEYFDGLLNGQVLLSALTPNVTGIRYHERCRAILTGEGSATAELLQSFRLPVTNADPDLPALRHCIDELSSRKTENATYSLYQRELSGSLGAEPANDLVALLLKMDQLTAGRTSDPLADFKRSFLHKYDQQEVPLMLALDPGSGIGYDNLAAAFGQHDEGFIDDLQSRQKPGDAARWTALEKIIFKKWNDLKTGASDKIILSAADLQELPASTDVLPPGMFVLFRPVDRELWIDAVGGVSGIELSARFADEGSDIEANLQRICAHEIKVNADYIFAEIAYSPNDRSSNINQRGHFYPFEIAVLTHSTRSEEQTIRLNDLLVSVRDGRVLLRSAKLNRYIIPRLSSAYNHKISTIPVFRFLCDLQYQGIKSAMSFTLSSLFPGMDYYPRLQLDNAVLSPATWILNEQQLSTISQGNATLQQQGRVPQYFSLNEGDNFLVFNQQNADEMELFKKCIKNKKTARLSEYVLPRQARLQDESGMPFAAQLVACVLNHQKSYPAPPRHYHSGRKKLKVKRSFLPGEDWLYLKVYTHYSVADAILLQFVLPVVRKYKKAHPSLQWFFIRYQDPNQHLRIRFCTAGIPTFALLAELMQKLRAGCRDGLISDVVLDSYQRELEKYSARLINEVESFFYRNSEFILSVFHAAELSTTFKLSFAVNSSLQLLQGFLPDNLERGNFLLLALRNLSQEFDGDKEVARKLDAKYRKFQERLIENKQYLTDQPKNRAFVAYKLAMQELSAQVAQWEEPKKYQLLINLVHLHVNRIFEHTPREYEFLIYHFMKKHQAYLHHTTPGRS